MRTQIALAWAAGMALAAGGATAADDTRKDADATAGVIYKASGLYGIHFYNAEGQDLGKLHDLMVDRDGRIVYGVLSHGGVAGVGDKLFAVPPDCLRTLKEVNGRNQFTIAGVSKQTLDNQPGIDEKDYPTAPNPLFAGGATDDTVRRNEAAASGDGKLMRLSKLDNTQVRNHAGEDCGKVRDFVVSLHDGKVTSAFIGYGGTAGIGDKHFAAPWKALELKATTGSPTEMSFVARVSKQNLDNNPGMAKGAFPTDKDLDLFRGTDK
jgi:sporulation protein YlmC with PRC-barrel domain